jgi:hypothetical protein
MVRILRTSFEGANWTVAPPPHFLMHATRQTPTPSISIPSSSLAIFSDAHALHPAPEQILILVNLAESIIYNLKYLIENDFQNNINENRVSVNFFYKLSKNQITSIKSIIYIIFFNKYLPFQPTLAKIIKFFR